MTLKLLVLLTLLIITVGVTAMLAALKSVSTAFVRYWARGGDAIASRVYPLKARGEAVVIVLELTKTLSLTGSIIILSVSIKPLVAWLLSSLVLFIFISVLPSLYFKSPGMRLLAMTSGLLTRYVSLLLPIAGPLGKWLDSNIAKESPSMLTKTELETLIDSTRKDDTDLSADELRLLKHALSYGDKTVRSVMSPRRVVVSVKEDDILSPELLNDLHKSGHSRFPVFGDDDNVAIGVLYVRDLVDVRNSSTVKQTMRKVVYYVNEERELDHVLHAFLRTKHHLFMVVNSFAEITGLITIEDVLEQILGRSIMDEFDQYQDLRAVATKQAKDSIKQNSQKMVE